MEAAISEHGVGPTTLASKRENELVDSTSEAALDRLEFVELNAKIFDIAARPDLFVERQARGR